MFTIKFTYRGQTRKHTFQDIHTFPSYEQICSQVHRVFSIANNFYLTRLLFHPVAAQHAHIMLSLKVTNSLDYNNCIRIHKDRPMEHGILRFSVIEALEPWNNLAPGSLRIAEPYRRPNANRDAGSASHNPFSIPPYFPSVSKPTDIDHHSLRSHRDITNPQRLAQPRRPTMPQHRASVPNLKSCCSVAEGRAEVHNMLTSFQESLNRVLSSNLANPMIASSDDTFKSGPPSSLCSVCTRNISSRTGLEGWRSCENCHVIVCNHCFDEDKPGFCLCTMGPHNMKQGSCLEESSSFLPIPRLPDPWSTSEVPTDSGQATMLHETPSNTMVPDPVIHNGVYCDACNKTIHGVRHKCLDCPDYDLCTPCITSGAAEAHDPFHEFFEITEPGRVIVHTVFNGDNERARTTRTGRSDRMVNGGGRPRPPSVTIHRATCDLCDSRIVGDRYKCLACPDFDTCGGCFSITNEQHPGHSFVRLQKADDCILKTTERQTHYATCNACSKTIVGVRYKCMHPECPDYDLCINCEALPIPVHPQIHPMLKMKTADTVVPTVYRVGQTHIIEPSLSTMPMKDSPMFSVHSPLEEERAPTPKAIPPLPAWMALSPEASERSPVPSEAFSAKPPLPPKPEMMQTSWRPISRQATSAQGYFGGEISNPFADIFAAPTPFESATKIDHYGYAVDADKDISLPSVPSHIPNPWPTTNSVERQELLQLMHNIAGSNTVDKPREAPPKTPLVDLSSVTSSLYAPSSKPEPKEEVKLPKTPLMPEFLPNLPVTGDLFNSLFNRFENVVNPASGHDNRNAQLTTEEVADKELQPEEPSRTATVFGDMSAAMSHLLQELEKLSPVPTNHPEPSGKVEEKRPVSLAESTISNEVLVNPPERRPSFVDGTPHSLIDLMTASFRDAKVEPKEENLETVLPLSATFVEDVTVPDGQVFPPGAEFVKCWRLLNDSGRDWPDTTELVFVAGETLSPAKDVGSASVVLGKVAAGTQVDAWTGELKAPDLPGRYVGYWRLKADGELFGNSLWIEINVKEADPRDSSDDSLAASSIIMPAASSVHQSQNVPSLVSHTASFSTSVVSTEDNVSEPGSDISLISVPSSSEDGDAELWHDSRSQTTAERAAAANAALASGSRTSPANAMDFVMLYDENSSDEDK